jgi:7-carboxy-7-deazaguanine synthase
MGKPLGVISGRFSAATPISQEQVPVRARAAAAGQLSIMDIYGPVIQGEGAMIGRATHFVRVGGCNYQNCSWCDTLFAVIPAQVRAGRTLMTVETVVKAIQALPVVPWVTLSGGNPALILAPLAEDLIGNLHRLGYKVAIETQGDPWKSWISQCDVVTTSVKPPSSGMQVKMAEVAQFVKFVPLGKLNFKIVIFDDKDLQWAIKLHQLYPQVPFYMQPGNEHVGEADVDALAQGVLTKLRWLTEQVLITPALADTIVLPQLHVLLSGNLRRG